MVRHSKVWRTVNYLRRNSSRRMSCCRRFELSIEAMSHGDKELLFAYRRKVFKELTYDERSKPNVRRKLKDQKWKEQRGLCAICGLELPERYTVLDRLNAAGGYIKENTR